jgi:hypothetical protein
VAASWFWATVSAPVVCVTMALFPPLGGYFSCISTPTVDCVTDISQIGAVGGAGSGQVANQATPTQAPPQGTPPGGS